MVNDSMLEVLLAWLDYSIYQLLIKYWLLFFRLGPKLVYISDIWCGKVQTAPFAEKTERWVGGQEHSSGICMP